MRPLTLIGGVLVIALMGLAVACGSSPASRLPFSPGAPGVAALQISGPSSLAPGQSAQLIVATRLSDGTVKSATSAPNIRWRSSNSSLLQVSASGLATAGQNSGEAVITAEVLPSATIRGSREVLVLPDGTYRLVGQVRETEAPFQGIAGARVDVSGTSLSTTADSGGSYRLYGVPASADIRVTATGYQTITQSLQLNAHATRNFQLPLSGPRLSLNGTFTLAIDVGACAGLPGDLQHRRYDASVTTTGSFVNVVLTEPRFRTLASQGNRFGGRAGPTGVTFTLDAYSSGFYFYYYYLYYPSLVERLPNNTHLVVSGTATTTQSGGGVSGSFANGSVINYDSRFPQVGTIIGNCTSSTGIQFTLTPR